MYHSVNPFFGKGERRSISFNAYIDEVIHDGDPKTNKYPVTLNASFSSDADQDEIFYKWRKC